MALRCKKYFDIISFLTQKAMQNINITIRDLKLAMAAVLLVLILAAAGGYYFGRKVQIDKDKGVLQMIPDINCGTKNR